MVEINLKTSFLIIRKKIWLIALITILCAGVSGLISYYILEPEYQSYTTLIMWRPQKFADTIEYNDLLLNQKLVSTYSEIIKSKVVTNELMSNLGLYFTDKELDEKINVTLLKDTEIIKILVKDKDAEVATQIANELANVFIKHVVNMMNIENIQVIDRAEIPLIPVKPKPVINMMITSVLGILLSIFSIFVHEYFDNRVKTSEDIENSLGLPIIGILPRLP